MKLNFLNFHSSSYIFIHISYVIYIFKLFKRDRETGNANGKIDVTNYSRSHVNLIFHFTCAVDHNNICNIFLK